MEVYNLGWNAETVGLLGTMLFTVIQACAFRSQNRVVWREKSGAGFSAPWLLCFNSVSFMGTVYGLSMHRIAMPFNGIVLSLYAVPLAVGIWRFQGFTRKESLLGWILMGVIASSIILPRKDIVYLVVSGFNVVIFSSQPLKLWREKSNGVVRVEVLLSALASVSFWMAYAIGVGDVPLEILTPCYLIIVIVSLFLWLQNRRRTMAAT